MINDILNEVKKEVTRAVKKHGKFNSPHEGWAVIMEEVDELWEEVRKKKNARNLKKMKEECVQISAMAVRFVYDLIENQNGKVRNI